MYVSQPVDDQPLSSSLIHHPSFVLSLSPWCAVSLLLSVSYLLPHSFCPVLCVSFFLPGLFLSRSFCLVLSVSFFSPCFFCFVLLFHSLSLVYSLLLFLSRFQFPLAVLLVIHALPFCLRLLSLTLSVSVRCVLTILGGVYTDIFKKFRFCFYDTYGTFSVEAFRFGWAFFTMRLGGDWTKQVKHIAKSFHIFMHAKKGGKI